MTAIIEPITVLGGFVFAVYATIAAAYWSDSGRWNDKLEILQDGPRKQVAQRIARKAERMFRICVGLMVLALAAVVLSLYVSVVWIRTISTVIILLEVAAILAMSVAFMLGKSVVPTRGDGNNNLKQRE